MQTNHAAIKPIGYLFDGRSNFTRCVVGRRPGKRQVAWLAKPGADDCGGERPGVFLWRAVIEPAQRAAANAAASAADLARRETELASQQRILSAIREQKEQYQDLFEQANDIVFILDLDGKFIYINQAAQKITGYTPAEMVGRHFSAFATHADEAVLWDFCNKTGSPTTNWPLIPKTGNR